MNCQEVMEYMQRQLDLDLSEAEQALLDEHLTSCGSCQAMMDRLLRLTSELSNLPKVHPPVSLVDNIMPRLAEIDEARRADSVVHIPHDSNDDPDAVRSEKPLRKRRLPFKVVGSVIAAGILLGIGIASFKPGDPLRLADTSTNMSADEAISGGESHHSTMSNMDTGFGVMDVPSHFANKEESASGDHNARQLESFGDQPRNNVAEDGGEETESVTGPAEQPPESTGSEGAQDDVSGLGYVPSEDGGLSFEFGDSLDLGAPTGLASPAGGYSAYIENSSVVVLDADSEKVYTSLKFTDADIYELKWESETRLTFKLSSGSSEQSYYIDLENGTEGKL